MNVINDCFIHGRYGGDGCPGCIRAREQLAKAHAAAGGETWASPLESADALSKLLGDVLEPLQRRWCHMFNDAGVCGLCELTKLRDAYEASRKEVTK